MTMAMVETMASILTVVSKIRHMTMVHMQTLGFRSVQPHTISINRARKTCTKLQKTRISLSQLIRMKLQLEPNLRWRTKMKYRLLQNSVLISWTSTTVLVKVLNNNSSKTFISSQV
jgi:hypothetical protein